MDLAFSEKGRVFRPPSPSRSQDTRRYDKELPSWSSKQRLQGRHRRQHGRDYKAQVQREPSHTLMPGLAVLLRIIEEEQNTSPQRSVYAPLMKVLRLAKHRV